MNEQPRPREALLLVVALFLLVAMAPAALASPGDCTPVVGMSQTRNWFVDGGFELLPGIATSEWELLAVGGADLREWADPASSAYTRPVDSPCGIPPTRVLLQASYRGFGATSDADIAAALAASIANIRARWPSVTRVDVIPVVGGPGHTICLLTGTRNVDASVMHPRIDTAIAAVANGTDVIAGPDLLVSACSDYLDGMGHLTIEGSTYVAGVVARHYLAPVISDVAVSTGDDGTGATVTWTTSLPADSRVDFGTDPGALSRSVGDAAFEVEHTVALAGLVPNTTYHYRVGSATPAGSLAIAPPGSLAPASFATPGTIGDSSAPDFGAGTIEGTVVVETGDGEVVLAPAVGTDFAEPGLPAGWSSLSWTGGAAVASDGRLSVDGARASTDAFFGSGRSVEFLASFGGEAHQDAGLGQNLESGSGESWALFGTLETADSLWTRTDVSGTTVDTPICPAPCALLGSDHRFRIDWTDSAVDFLIDGTPVHSEPVVVAGDLRPVVSDLDLGGATIVVDWLRLSPYPGSGAFTSRVLDAGETVDWGSLRWIAKAPPGTGIGLEVRGGDTPTPDEGWSAFVPVPDSGDPIPGSTRYLQYRAQLSTTDPDETPVLESVTASFGRANVPPEAGSFADSTTEDVPVQLTLTGTDLDGDVLAFAVEADPVNGSLGSISDPTCGGTVCSAVVTYTPSPDFTGADQFTYQVSDGLAVSAPATVDLTVEPAPSAIELRAASSATTNGATSLAIPAPAGVQAGDVLVAAIAVRGNPTVTPPLGWTFLLNTGSGIVMHEVSFVHVAGDAEPASYVWTLSVSQSAAGAIVAYLGVDPLSPVVAWAGQSNASSAQVTAPSVEATGVGQLLVGLFGLATTTAFSPPATMLERVEVATVGARRNVSLEIADEVLLLVGATGTRVASATNAAVNVGQVVALRPA